MASGSGKYTGINKFRKQQSQAGMRGQGVMEFKPQTDFGVAKDLFGSAGGVAPF